MAATLTSDELWEYFEGLSEGRRELVWVRAARELGAPVTEFEPDDPQIDEVSEEVLRRMWVGDMFDRLVALGELERHVGADGVARFRSP